MATITLTANTDVSALSLANGDTIDLAGFVLTFDVQPTVTGIQVTTPGTAGTCVFPVACVIPTWDFFAGTATIIVTLPANCEIGDVTSGSATGARGVTTCNGIIGKAKGGSGINSHGVFTNNGHVEIAEGSDVVSGANGVTTNNGTVGVAGGGLGGSPGVATNNGTVGIANAGKGNVSTSHGVTVNNGAVGVANGGIGNNANGINLNNGSCGQANGGQGPLARGIRFNVGTCLRAFDGTEKAIDETRGDLKLVIGPDFRTAINNPLGELTTIYSIGPLSELATIPAGVQVITLSEGTGTAAFTGIRGISRRLGT